VWLAGEVPAAEAHFVRQQKRALIEAAMPDDVIAYDHSHLNALPRWSEWSVRAEQDYECQPAALGFGCGHAALYRINARYRLARSFSGVELQNYGRETAHGYSGLFRLFLAWSAFEPYYKALGLTAKTRDAWFSKYAPSEADVRIRALDPKNCFFHLILNKVRGDVEENLAAYVKNQPYGLTYLPAAVRHVFAHGILTPNANKAQPLDVAQLTAYMADMLLNAVAADFEARVVALPPRDPAA
jgi:hypothetical protein